MKALRFVVMYRWPQVEQRLNRAQELREFLEADKNKLKLKE